MIELNEATRRFVSAHADDDVTCLALQTPPEGVDIAFALQQIKGRQKAQEKLPDYYACSEVLYPPTVSMEQCYVGMPYSVKHIRLHCGVVEHVLEDNVLANL